MPATLPDLTDAETWKERAVAETDAVDGRIVDPHETPPTDGNGWPLWLPGDPA